MLTAAEIRQLLDLLCQEVVVAPTLQFPYAITQRRSGYAGDPERAALQGKLSIMLEVAHRRGEGAGG